MTSSTLDIILNELSFTSLSSRDQAKGTMEDLVQMLSVFRAFGFDGGLRYEDLIFRMPLCKEYTVADWFHDPTVDQDVKGLFKGKADRCPILKDEPYAEARRHGCEFRIQGIQCDSLGAAYLLDMPAVSLLSDDIWDEPLLTIQVDEIIDSTGIERTDEVVVHSASLRHVVMHKAWLQRKTLAPVMTGTDLWKYRHIFYPSIEFCVEVEKQLEKLSMPSLLHQVRVRLDALENYSDEWSGERMLVSLPEHSPESDTTMDNERLRKLRQFSRLSGEKIICELHMKIKFFNWRMHFYPDYENKKFIVGYIGVHLPVN